MLHQLYRRLTICRLVSGFPLCVQQQEEQSVKILSRVSLIKDGQKYKLDVQKLSGFLSNIGTLHFCIVAN